MKTQAVLIVFLMLASALVPLSAVGGAEPANEPEFAPEPAQEPFENEPMSLILNARRADRGPFYLNFYQTERGPAAVASILQGEDFARLFRYPYQPGQKVSSTYDENLEAVLDIYVNSMDVPGKTIRFKVDIDRNGDGFNDTTIDFPPYTTLHNASPEHVVARGTVYFREPDIDKDLSAARIFLKVWRTDTIEDLNNRLKVYAGFLSDTEMKVESRLYIPWVNPVPHVEINSPLDRNLTGKFYYNNEPILFDGRGSRDPTGEALGFVWTFDRLEYPPVYDKETFNRSFKEPGWYTIKLNVSNSLYFTNETTITIQVVYKNHAPKITPKIKNQLGTFDPAPDHHYTHAFVTEEWYAEVTDVDGDDVSIKWDFGDGFTSTAMYVNHSYKTPGEYLLTLEAFDGNATSGRVKKSIIVTVDPNNEPVGVIEVSAPMSDDVTPSKTSPNYRGTEIRVNLGDQIVFDASKSRDPDGQPIRSFKWEFDDVYATEENPNVATVVRASHKFLVEGQYNVSLTLFDGVKYGAAHVWILTNQAPIAVPPEPMIAETDDVLSFDGSRSSDPDIEDELRFKWDFGDNIRTEWSDSAFATHSYKISATYTATLYVTDGMLQHSATVRVRVDSRNHIPVAVATIQEDPNDLWTNMTVHFSSVGSYDIDGEGRITYVWEFGDGTDPSTMANPTHEYDEPGTYRATLTVIDVRSAFATAELILTVQRNYGDSDIIHRALESDDRGGKVFRDPPKDAVGQVAVMRTGWVAYLCDLRKDQTIEVEITVIGDRPADIYLFREVNFQTYKRNPKATFVPFETKGYYKGLTGPYKYEFTPLQSDRYYIVIDNKDDPIGTYTEGPVDYTIKITAAWEEDSGIPGPTSALALSAMAAVAAVAVMSRRRRM